MPPTISLKLPISEYKEVHGGVMHCALRTRSRNPRESSLDMLFSRSMFLSPGATTQIERHNRFAALRRAKQPFQQRVNLSSRQRDALAPVRKTLVGGLRLYKRCISPVLGPACRFVPSCSDYAVQSLEEFGVVRGILLAMWRILRCNPLGGSGYDPPRWPPVPYGHVGALPPTVSPENETRDDSS